MSLLAFITDIHTLGLAAAQGLRFMTGFYWDRDNDTRAWSKRFFDRHGRMPTSAQASVYSAIRHYLRAIEAAGTDAALPRAFDCTPVVRSNHPHRKWRFNMGTTILAWLITILGLLMIAGGIWDLVDL